jgi:hypothetical protein
MLRYLICAVEDMAGACGSGKLKHRAARTTLRFGKQPQWSGRRAKLTV